MTPSLKSDFAARLRAYLADKNMTQTELADCLWVSPSYINKICRGVRPPTEALFAAFWASPILIAKGGLVHVVGRRLSRPRPAA